MDEESKLVADKIENGSYFNEALEWYGTRYTFIQTQFSQMLIFAIISIIAFIITISGFFSFLPVVDKKLFIVYHEITPENTIHVQQLMEAGQDPDHALTKYFTEEYVKFHEEYVVERSERDFNFVSSLSGGDVLQDYLNAISPDNPTSPFIVYANRGRRDVIIKSLRFYDEKGEMIAHSVPKGKAVVYFTAVENFGAQAQRTLDYIANIDFDYSKIVVDQKTNQLTHESKMVITNYTTKLNSDPK